ncbi:MAG TPA: Ig-like domain-containing protein [Actinomycetota bacterium]|nr:Ig-like domain-containing protein [Actinomycetota bacterium]
MKKRRELGVLIAIVTAIALALPLGGVAFATHGAEPVAVVDLEPEQDTASVGACNAYTIDARDDDVDPAEGEVIDVIASQEFRENETAPALQFCVPTTVAPAQGGQAGQAAQNPTTRNEDTDCPTQEAPNEDCVIIHGQFTTDANGRVIFGIRSNQEGDVQVTAFAEGQDPDCAPATVNNMPDAPAGNCAEPQDTAMKTFTAGGQEGVNTLDCEPEFATNNLAAGDRRHTFTCTATNAAGDPVAGVEVDFVVTAGPNADNNTLPGAQPVRGSCTTTTGTEGNAGQGTIGQAVCAYDEDDDLESNETGVDTIVAFVDRDNDNTIDANERQDEIQKAWTRAPRNIDCEPENDTNNPGDEPHVVTCTVTDALGNPVGDVVVTFTENGPGRFEGDPNRITDNQGRVAITTTAQQNEEGVQEITGTITDEDASTPGTQGGTTVQNAECNRPANQPTQGDPAGNCADQVLKNWDEPTQPPPPPPQPECRDNIDNDGDGLIDFPNDPNCESPHDNSESLGGGGDRECANVGAILGTAGNDILVGTDGDDVICGFEGDDTLRGNAGNDILLGQAGNDTIEGGDGQDTARGGAGADSLEGGEGKDLLRGGTGPDSIKGNRGHDLLRGGRGHDTLRGGFGNDTMRGGRGIDSCRDRYGFNIIRGCER